MPWAWVAAAVITAISGAVSQDQARKNSNKQIAAAKEQAERERKQYDEQLAAEENAAKLAAANSAEGVATIETGSDVGSSYFKSESTKKKKKAAASTVSSTLGLKV